MEDDVQHLLARVPQGRRRRNRARPHQPRLLPYELRYHRASDPLPQPPLAPDLAHRLRRHDGRLALPLLPP